MKNQALRGGGPEGRWRCNKCLTSVKLLDPVGRIGCAVLAVLMTAAGPWAAVTSRVQRESERTWIVLLLGALAAALIAIFVVDTKRQRKHPLK